MITVKRGDTHAIVLTVNADLTGCEVRLLAKLKQEETIELESTITDAASGEVTHNLTGLLPVGLYRVELETTKAGVVTTFPNDSYEQLCVVEDL